MPYADKEKQKEYVREWQRENRNKGMYQCYTDDEEKEIIDMHRRGEGFEHIANIIGRSSGAVKAKMFRMGLKYKKDWSEDDFIIIKKEYAKGTPVKDIAILLDTTPGSIEKQAKNLGLTVKIGSPEFKAKCSKRNKKLWDDPEHIFNKEEYRDKLREHHKDPNHIVNSEEFRQALSDRAYVNKPGLRFQNNMKGRRSYGGFRDDIGHYVRSRWEANIARYLIYLKDKGEISGYEYEPDCFEFSDIKRGNRSYTPDFKVYKKDGSVEYWEVKGYMDKDSKVKLKRMKKYYPDVDIVMIQKDEYKAIQKWSRLIPGWE